MKYLIVGLGNIGPKYVDTRHNVGFQILDHLLAKKEAPWSSERYGDIAEYRFKGRKAVLLKPNTFMNLSGKAVRYWMQKENIETDSLLVLTDDLALPFGTLRLRAKGSDGGHNGLRDIQEMIGTQIYPRLRFGIGDRFDRGRQVDYVLGQWEKEELREMEEHLDMSVKMIKSFMTIGLNRTMSEFNKRKKKEEK